MQFDRKQFHYHGGYLTYGPENKFIARFKYRGAPFSKADMVKVLVKHYTVEGYLERLKTEAPLEILRKDGLFDIFAIMEAKAAKRMARAA